MGPANQPRVLIEALEDVRESQDIEGQCRAIGGTEVALGAESRYGPMPVSRLAERRPRWNGNERQE
jgi:hypothetical protein